MILKDYQMDLIKDQKYVVLATSDKEAKPRAIFVEVNDIQADTIIITDNEMKTTRENILQNNQVAVLAFKLDFSLCLKIEGEAEYHTDGEYFDFVKKHPANKKFLPKGAIIIKIENVIEFN